jgi:UDP-glucose 4-epimerase
VRVVVTGGAGQLGSRVLRRLAHDRKITAITSIDLRPLAVASPKVRAVIADVRDPEIARHLEGHDALVHLAFVVTDVRPRAEIDAINVGGSANVFAAAARVGIKQIVYSSSIAAYGVVPGHPEPITEEATRVHQPSFAYAATKFEVEALLDRFELEHPDIVVARLRPALLLGHDMDHALGDSLRRSRLADLGAAPLPVVWDEDVADALALALLKGARGAFNLAADDALTSRELAQRTDLRVMRIPPWLSRFVVASPRIAKLATGRAVDPAWLESAGSRMIISSERAKRELGWRPRCPTALDVVRRHRVEVARRLDPRIAFFFRAVGRSGPRSSAEQERGIKLDIHLRLTSPDGGDVTIALDQGSIAIRRGVPRPPSATVTLTTETFRQLLAGHTDVTTAQLVGSVRLEGEPAAAMVLDAIFTGLRAAGKRSGWRGMVARRLATWCSNTESPAAITAQGAGP